jgi:hypothetical protein
VVTVATAAATGVGIALPLISAGSAQAAGASTWDKVAQCESGGVWSANTGNGFFGGLAITQATWDQYGGDAYASRPDLATRDQQITVAEKVLGDLGANAWPGCEITTGLLLDTSTPDVDPSSTPAPDPSGPTGIQPSAGSTTAPTGSGTATATPTPTTTDGSTAPSAPATPSDPATPSGSGTPSAGATPTPTTTDGSAATGSGRHGKPYDPTDEELAAKDRATRTEVLSTVGAATGSGATSGHRAKSSAGDAGSGGKTAGGYRVGSGESLSGIASAEHVAGGWRALYEANRDLIGDDPNLIKPGQILNLA